MIAPNSSQSVVQEPVEIPTILLVGPGRQNYFHNNTKVQLASSPSFLCEHTEDASRGHLTYDVATDCMVLLGIIVDDEKADVNCTLLTLFNCLQRQRGEPNPPLSSWTLKKGAKI